MQHSSQSKIWDEWLTHKPFSGHWNTPINWNSRIFRANLTTLCKTAVQFWMLLEISRSQGHTNTTKETHIYFKIR